MIAGLIRMTIGRPALDPAAADEHGITPVSEPGIAPITTPVGKPVTWPVTKPCWGLGALVDMRPAVLCHHGQLHGQAGDRHSEARARKRDALVRIELWVDRVLVPVRLCGDDAYRGPHH